MAIKKLYYIFIFLVLISSCVTLHNGNISSGPIVTEEFYCVDSASGRCENYYILGFGNSSKDDLIKRAKANMCKNRPLRTSEYYSNITTDVSKKFVLGFIYMNTCVTVSADVYSKYPKSKIEEISKQEKINIIEKSGFYITICNDTLYNGMNVYYSENKNKVYEYKFHVIKNNEFEFVPLSQNQPKLNPDKMGFIFSKNAKAGRFKIGDIVKSRVFVLKEKFEIVGLNSTHAILKDEDTFYSQLITDLELED